MQAQVSAIGSAPVRYSDRYRLGVALLLMLAYTLNSTDRSIISIVGQALKLDLKLTDTQLGLLAGTAFAMLYAISGIPIARLAERYNRVTIISLALVVWSGLTALCGAATSFAQLLCIRIGVGVGEAGCSPPAHSLISDYFEPRRRASALSIYSLGISLGYLFGAVVGGYVAMHYGWRSACVAVGVPGLIVAYIVKRFVTEPPRGYSERALTHSDAVAVASSDRPKPLSLAGECSELLAVARTLLFRWPVGNIVVGVVLATFASHGSYAFVPAYFNRAFSLDYATIGVIAGLAGGVSVGLGTIAGGVIADRVSVRSARWYALIPAIGLAMATPLYVLAFLQNDWRSTALLLAVPGFFQYISWAPTFGVIQNVVDTRRRATATAVLFVFLNAISLAGGPPFTGWTIDRLAQFSFSHPAADTVWKSVEALAGDAAATPVSFRASCPGGGARAGDSAVAKAACASALALASREGILLTVLIYAWAACHYLLGAIGLDRQMQMAAVRNAAVAERR